MAEAKKTTAASTAKKTTSTTAKKTTTTKKPSTATTAKKTSTTAKSTTAKKTTTAKKESTVEKEIGKVMSAAKEGNTVAAGKITVKAAEKPAAKNDAPLLMDVKEIKKSYGKVEVLRGINFKVNAGERVAIVGANGAGKSTLSEIIARVKESTSGEINYYFEPDNSESKGKGNISKHIGIQFQDSSYPDFYKVHDLVKFVIGAAKLNITPEELDELYETFDLLTLKNEVAKGLSGGQQQRLNILLAIVNNPKLLILDEVGTGLDVESRTKIKSYIKAYAEDHQAAILLVSHNSDEVMELVDRVITIHNGEVFHDQMLADIIKEHKHFDNYMNDLYLNVFKKVLDVRANKSGRQERNKKEEA